MAHGSGVRIELTAGQLPSLPGARALASAGQLTGGCRRNREWLADRVEVDGEVPADLVEIAYDPQTSGGLLAAVPASTADAAVAALRAAGVACAAIVGAVRERGAGPWVVVG